ncbi:LOW QUALITY PROTEIN: G patch domain-containing protein 1 homolog [Diaphorina citri]|uniref:LOW QUALITY PROTEIN: G patch domain-containing protein 1 homolog n=1 Tax=Diaphorina citri TaxID=121845 RepID=A0A3Q0J3V3_DIACI|nr:LOW QUALITY PROTEIN: G patch domain-containing protein 1 homolog [Diaphorina citri]
MLGLNDVYEVQARKPINVQDQIATDKHGKRRFHGAFTGGFSAGFCNTVGSLEGWTPSTFKSSRSERAATIQSSAQLPEHFMDEEDMAEFGIAPKRIQIASSYEANAEGARRQRGQGTGTIPGVPVLETLLEPVPDTIGMKLLRRMGWKPGQGIGPRLSRREKQAATARDLSRPKVYGCAMPGDREGTAGKGQEEEEEEEEECESGFTYAPNEYVQYLVKPKDDEFGLGYKGLDRKPVLSSEKRGFNLFDLDEPPGRNEAQDSGVTFIGRNNKKIKIHVIWMSHPVEMRLRIPALRSSRNNKKIKIHGQAFGVGAFEVEDDDIYATEDMSRYDTSLAPTGTRAPREPKPKPGDTTMAETKERPQGENRILAKEGHSVGSTFRPFANDPEKQKRYEQYITFVKLGVKDRLVQIQPPSMTEWERQREAQEFASAHALYLPLSGAMADRFTRGSQADDTNPLVKVEKSIDPGDETLRNAAKSKMFGKLTRELSVWVPSDLWLWGTDFVCFEWPLKKNVYDSSKKMAFN